MRQALSMALMDYDGALVVIAHDRHLLRSVCEDLYIVHDGGVEHFEEDIDHYPDWLRARERAAGEAAMLAGGNAVDEAPVHGREARKAARREAAERRRQLRPLENQVQRIEKRLGEHREALVEIESALADESLYGAGGEQARLTGLLERQVELREAVEQQEWEWFEASQALEQAKANIEGS